MDEMDHQTKMIEIAIRDYLDNQGVDLTEEQVRHAFNGVQNWLQEALPDVIAQSVQNAL